MRLFKKIQFSNINLYRFFFDSQTELARRLNLNDANSNWGSSQNHHSVDFHRLTHVATVQVAQLLDFEIFRHRQLVQVVRQLLGRRSPVGTFHREDGAQEVGDLFWNFWLAESLLGRLDRQRGHTRAEAENLRLQLKLAMKLLMLLIKA